MVQEKKLEEVFAARAKILTDTLPFIFKADKKVSRQLIKSITVHKAIAEDVRLLKNPKGIKTDVNGVIEKYSGVMEVVEEECHDAKKCPLSQGIIQREWKGRCGHVFEESAVKAYIQAGKKECPVFGCNKRLA